MPFSAKVGFFASGGAPTPEGDYDWPGYMSSTQFTNEVDGDFTNVGAATFSQVSASSMGYRYGVLADNGNVYMMPRTVSNFLEFEPSSNTVNQISVSGVGSNEYTGGALASNGNIYCCAFSTSATILEFNPADGSSSEVTPTGDYSNYNIGGVTLPSGKVMFMPRSTGGWFTIYDPTTNTASKAGASTTIKELSEDFEYVGGVSSTNGKSYFMPFNGQEVSYYDETADSWTDIDVSADVSNNSGAFQGGAMMTDGRIVGVPYNYNELFVFDPSDDSFYSDAYGMSLSGTNKFIGGGLAPNGNVYFANFNASNVIEFDTQANVSVLRAPGGLRTSCISVVPTGDDRLVYVPISGSNFTQVVTGKTPTYPEALKSPQLNRGG